MKKYLRAIQTFLRKVINHQLSGHHDYYLSHLSKNVGLISGWTLRRIFTGIVISEDQEVPLRSLPKDAIIVYTLKYKSYFEFLFYHTRLAQLGLPVPEWGFDFRIILWQPVLKFYKTLLSKMDSLIEHRTFSDPYESDFIKNLISNESAAILPLVEKKGFYRRFIKSKKDPLHYLIELQQTSEKTIYIVPLLMFFGKKPIPEIPGIGDLIFGSAQRPGIIRRFITLFKNPGQVFVEISQPLNLKEFTLKPWDPEKGVEYQSLFLRRELLRQHNRHRQSITGPVIKSNEELKESILTNERLRLFMEQHAKSRNLSIHRVRKQADSYLDEIAANYNFFWVKAMAAVARWVINIMFDGAVIDKEGLKRVKTMSQKGPLIIIPCHKSHIDYIILSYVLFANNMPCPQVAAGKNLAFWPMGSIFRAGGAFFIRRSFKGAVLYSKVFSEYIHKLLQEGFNIEQFFEGGRSRTGKLILPKLGLLSILVNAFKNKACDDMIFVPVYIGYDQVIEESAYLHEIEGGKKEPENFKQVLKARRFLKKRYGKIYINFHEPISMNDLLKSHKTPIQEMKTKEINQITRYLGMRISNAIDREIVVTSHALTAAALLNWQKKYFSFDQIKTNVNTYLKYLTILDVKLSDTLMLDSDHAVRQAFDSYLQRKIVDKIPPSKTIAQKKSAYVVSTNKRLVLDYYKNNCIADFVPAAITAIAILRRDAFQFTTMDLHEDYELLKDILKFEFAFDVDRPSEFYIHRSIDAFVEDASLMPHASLQDTYNLTSAGLRKLKLFGRFLKTYMESYWIALNFFKENQKNTTSPKERLKKIQTIGSKMYKRREIDLKESLSKVNYENALSFFASQRIRGSEDIERIKTFEEIFIKVLGMI